MTAITRIWGNGDHERCRLCSSCGASREGVCLVLTEHPVSDDEMPLYASAGDKEPITLPRESRGS